MEHATALIVSAAPSHANITVAGQVSLAQANSRQIVPEQADNDATLIALWLHGRPETTRSAYTRDAGALFAFTRKQLRATTLGDLQEFATSLAGLAPASQARKLAAVKSLCAFAHKLGYLVYDLARPLQMPRLRDRLAERIITEAEAQRLIQSEPNPRNHALLRLMYGLGLRVSEACGLCWRDLKSAKSGGVATIHGKGGKTRHVAIPPKLWKQLAALKRDAGPEDPIIRSQRGGPIDRSAAHRVVKAAVKRAGLPDAVSAHYLRHAHASHSLDHAVPIHVLQSSLGHGSLTTTTRYVHVAGGDSSSKYLPE